MVLASSCEFLRSGVLYTPPLLANNDKIRESFLGKYPTIVSLFTTVMRSVVGIAGLAAAIQHFTNGSFPYVFINVVATNAALSP